MGMRIMMFQLSGFYVTRKQGRYHKVNARVPKGYKVSGMSP